VPVALITGASTGIGRATALRLTRAGWTVLAGVRDAADGERLITDAGAQARSGEENTAAGAASSSRSPLDGCLLPLTLDVTNAEQIAGAAARVEELARSGGDSRRGGLDALVNNAGVAGVGGPLELIALEDVRGQLEVNVLGQIAVTQALLPALRRARGRIAFVSSIGGRVAIPFTAPYAASKHAVEAIGDALRVELRSSGVQVALIEPGSIATPIWDKGRAEAERVSVPEELQREYGHVPSAMEKVVEDTQRRGLPPERVARTIERALTARRMKARYLVGRDARGMVLMRRGLSDAVFDRVLRRVLGV
jgi:NAD(P)-dependent dehydrogenase (short-subunit alcohol dehydrogenase family)